MMMSVDELGSCWQMGIIKRVQADHRGWPRAGYDRGGYRGGGGGGYDRGYNRDRYESRYDDRDRYGSRYGGSSSYGGYNRGDVCCRIADMLLREATWLSTLGTVHEWCMIVLSCGDNPVPCLFV